jgi:hypothetical protein
MKQNLAALRMFLSVTVMSVLVLGPAARPIIEPRAIVLTVITCRNQVMGTVVVTDSRGRTYALGCSPDQRTAFSPARQSPAADAPWLVAVTARPVSSREGLPRACRFQVTSIPTHVQCAAASPAPLTVDFDLIWTAGFPPEARGIDW